MKGLNLDELLASLKQEKTAEEVFADNLAEEAPEEEAPIEEAPEEAPEEDPIEEDPIEEDPADLSKVSSLLDSEWVPFEQDGKKYLLKHAAETKAIMDKSDLSIDQKFDMLRESNLVKIAEAVGIEEQAKLFATTFYHELRKLAEAEETPQEQVKEAEVVILTNLYQKYFGR